MTAPARPPIIPPQPDNVPEAMRKLRRWAPWRAEWNEKKQKYEKIPHRAARPEYGLSNKNATGWVSFDEAMAVYQVNRDKFAGVGYLMTGPHGITGVDLDHCRDPKTGEIADWALEVVRTLNSYTEVSPSGTGLHVMVAAQVPEDWTNHEQGIEVYGGNEARFLCITGERIEGVTGWHREDISRRPMSVFEGLAEAFRKAPTKAEVLDLHLPDLLPLEFLPTLAELELPPHASNFLLEGPEPGDRSRQLFATAIALSQAGLQPDEVLSILEANEHAMEVALDHRRQDYDKALRYLWDQCQNGRARGEQIAEEGLGAFDALDEVDRSAPPSNDRQEAPAPADTGMDDFDVLPDDGQSNDHQISAPARKLHFPLLTPDQFMKRKPMSWLVRGVLPRAALAVIYGASTAGKTFFTFDLVASIVRGIEWNGRRVTRGKGVYIVAEGSEGFRNRVQAYCEFHGIGPGELDIVILPAAPNLMDKAQVVELIKDLQTLGPLDFVVVDTYARVMVGGNENDAKDTTTMVSHCARIHKHTGALVILVHHSGKDPSSGARGSSVLKAAADVEIEVVRTKEYRSARVAKMKDGDDSGEFRFTLPIVELGENEDGDAITSCVVQHRDHDGTPAPSAEGLKGQAALIFSTLADLIDLAGTVTYAEGIEHCVAQLPHEEGKRDRRRDAVSRTFEKLMGENRLKVEDNHLVVF
jgi:hypothetical protein